VGGLYCPGVTETPLITVAGPADRQRIVDCLVAAFPRDPVLRFLFPDDYPRQAAAFFGYLFDKRVNKGTVWAVGGIAAAIWEPPSGGDDPADGIDLPADAGARMKEYDDAVHAALPDEPFWYLGVLGTRPEAAGRGLGRALMAEGLRRAAEDGLPAFLETSKPENVGFYRRAGWEVAAEFDEPLHTWVMRQ
jgi:ribosomal protein S18 acetylase RimI-like enzyme